jgi:integrase
MAAKLLTARAVETMKPRRDAAGEAIRAEYPDAACPGLYLVVQPSGTRSWALRYRRPNGKTAKLTLGDAGSVTLAAARHAASAARLQLERGADPAPKRLPATAYAPEGGEAVEAAFGSFLELHARRKTRPSTAWATERVFNRNVLPAWRGRSIHDIKRRDVIDLVEQIAADRPYLANRTLATLSKFYNWLIARAVVKMSPVTGVERPHKEKARTRTLNDDELRQLWKACNGPFGDALKVLVLTGARRNEVSQMRWSEIDEKRRLWVLPASRSKNHHEHTVPLSSQAWTLIQAQRRFLGCDFVFTADGRRPVTGWDKAKSRIGAKAGIAEDSWRLHDLRRTCASGMQRLGVPVPVIEKALNHLSGTFRGIVGTYQQHDYADEIRVALQRWGDHVEQMVSSKPARARRGGARRARA